MAYIKPEIVETVIQQSDLVEVISEYVDLRRSGANYQGKSPFNDEKTGSFMVSPSKGIWKDFSSGKGGSTAVGFLMEKGFTYPEALKHLAKKYNVTIEYDDSEQAKHYQEKEQKKEKLRPLLESVIRRYEEEFQKLPEEHPAKIEIFKKRKYTQEIVDLYRIGYAPGRKFIYDFCEKTDRKKDAIDLGLINESNDKWYDRVIYPLIECKGTTNYPVGLAGRILNKDKKPKWLNSSGSELYQKSFFWYGLDKAREEITKREEVWLVEGYNDVIAWQTNGILNTIASCGTAIADSQIEILKKLRCKKVILCFDQDNSGKDAMGRYIPEFMHHGFRVQTVALYPELDPDDFVRYYNKPDLTDLGTNSDYRQDGFKFLMQKAFGGKDEIDRAVETKNLVALIAKIEDGPTREIFSNWLSDESGITRAEIRKLLKEKKEKQKSFISPEQDEFYILPPTVKEPLDKLRPEIEKYQMFMANNQIWVQTKKDGPPYSFRSVSNFSISIITHMHDEKFPMKLVRIKNVHGVERIFDMKSSDMNSPMSFENAVTAQGNFQWRGNKQDHDNLKSYLMDKMGTGRKIDVLGWQPEGFWIWNNKILDPSGQEVLMDENGVFERGKISYYVPSANSIYRTNMYKFEAQKKLRSIPTTVGFENYASQVLKVHREPGMMAILFAIASIFQDIVVAETNSFPMLFLIGPASSGKDQLADVAQSFFGQPQTGINLEGGVSTIKAQVREFAQFSNAISQLSEYKNGNSELDGVLKGLWDRRGYKRGTIESAVATDSIPILSSVLMTGNYAPDQEALITRLVWVFMEKTVFTDEETKEFEKLNDMTKKGISSFTDDFLMFRNEIQENFKSSFRGFKAVLSERKPEANSRMISNLSVLGAFYKMFNREFSFPFSQIEMMDFFESTIDKQMNKLDSANIILRWWDCFLASMRGNVADQITYERDFKMSGNNLYFNFTSCYIRISRQWSSQYKDTVPAKGVMQDSLKKDSSWVGMKSATRMSKGKQGHNTSAYIIDIDKIPLKDEIKSAIEFQMNDSYENIVNSTGNASKDSKNEQPQRKIPF